MQSFKAPLPQHVSLTANDLHCNSQSHFYLRGDDRSRHGSRLTDLGELEHSSGSAFIHMDAVNFSKSLDYGGFKASDISSIVPNSLQFGGLTSSLGSGEMGSSGVMGFGVSAPESLGTGHFKHWGDMTLQQKLQTDASTNVDHAKNQFPVAQHKGLMAAVDSMDSCQAVRDQKALRRQAQNREAARKSRIRRKAYVQQLEDSRARLTRLEQDMKRARTQGMFVASGNSADRSHSIGGGGVMAFDMDYTEWLDKHQRLINNLRSAFDSHVSDTDLQLVVDRVMLHYNEVFRLKSSGAKLDLFHILSGMWKSPAERCFMWLGGFRSSEILKVLRNQIEPLTEQQITAISNLQGSSQQAEDALNQGMEALQQSLVGTLSSTTSGLHDSDNITEYMEQMTVAMSQLATVGDFLRQADLLRQQTLQQLQRILTTRQAARALLAFNDYKSRIQALSSLWLARPRNDRSMFE